MKFRNRLGELATFEQVASQDLPPVEATPFERGKASVTGLIAADIIRHKIEQLTADKARLEKAQHELIEANGRLREQRQQDSETISDLKDTVREMERAIADATDGRRVF